MQGGMCRRGRTSRTASFGTKPVVVTYTRLHLPRVAVTPASAHQAHSNGQLRGRGYLKCVLTGELVFDYKQLE